MVGKIRRPRQKLHAAAVKFVSQDGGPGEAGDKQTAQKQVAQQQTAQLQTAQPLECAANRASEQGAPPRPQADGHGSAAKGRPVLPSSIFSGTAIRLDQLVQNLNTESPAPAVCAAPEERKLQPKKLKMKERRERLLQREKGMWLQDGSRDENIGHSFPDQNIPAVRTNNHLKLPKSGFLK
ncbi:protein FAM207A [Arapaima gigas]